MTLARIRRELLMRRGHVLWSIGISIFFITITATILAALALLSFNHVADRFAAAGVVFGGAAMLLTVIAALVALLAYAVSTGSPDLQLRASFYFSKPNNPSFEAARTQGPIEAKSFKQLMGHVAIRNNSRYSAVNPAVIIRLRGMAILPKDGMMPEEWVRLEFVTTRGVISLQWDGGPKYSIHGESTRILPTLNLDRLIRYSEQDPSEISIEILAEGYRKELTLPVTFKVEGEPEPEDSANPLPEWI